MPDARPFEADATLVANKHRKKRHVLARKGNRWRVVRVYRGHPLQWRGGRRGGVRVIYVRPGGRTQVIYARPGGRPLIDRYAFPPPSYRLPPALGTDPVDRATRTPADAPKKATVARKAVDKPASNDRPSSRRDAARAAAERPLAGRVDCGKGASIVTGYGFSDVKPTSCAGNVYTFEGKRDSADYSVRLNAADGEILGVKKRPAQTSGAEATQQ